MRLRSFALAVVLLSFPLVAHAVPGTVPFKARVEDNGTALTGDHAFKFQIYDAASGGALLWEEPETNLTVDSGLLVYELGSVVPLDAAIASGSQIYLQITVDGVKMDPRMAVSSVPYALSAGDTEAIAGTAVDTSTPGSGDVLRYVANKWTPSSDYVDRSSAQTIAGNKTFSDLVGLQGATPWAPLTFANSLGDKISLYGGNGVHYGFGIQSSQLQIHTNTSGADIVFGYGTSAALTETMRIRGNGRVGIGISTPADTLDVNGSALVRGVVGGLQGGSGAGLVGRSGHTMSFEWTGSAYRFWVDVTDVTSAVKTFVIDHPTDPDRFLVHATLEGPESAVYYRGTARLRDGMAEITLPAYFEAETRAEGRTVQVTPIFDSAPEPVSMLAATHVKDGVFLVKAIDRRNPGQAFDWEVKAVRKDVAPLVVEPRRDQVDVHGDGPYRYLTPKRSGN